MFTARVINFYYKSKITRNSPWSHAILTTHSNSCDLEVERPIAKTLSCRPQSAETKHEILSNVHGSKQEKQVGT